MGIVPGSSMVEQEAVNFEVAGSSPVPGANLKIYPYLIVLAFSMLLPFRDVL